MKLLSTLKTAIGGLRTNKSRSLLTILGIVIGITAIILLMSLGQGAQDLILGQLQGMGSKTIFILPGRQPKGTADAAQMMSDSLKSSDLDVLKRKSNVPDVDKIMPLVFGGATASYESETYRLTIFGSSETISEIMDLSTEFGSFFTEEEANAAADVVVIGSKVKKELFGDSDALGQRIKIKGRNLRVVGILPQKGQVSFFNFDEVAIVPYTTAQKYIFGIKFFHRIAVTAKTDDGIARTVSDIQVALRNAHGITDPDKDDFHIETQADLAERLGVITNVFTLFLVAVAAISLVVGGIGIMNIMLVAVSERTREIGLRKAIGATESDILSQFLLEAVLLTGAGGFVGIAIGTSLSFIAALILSKVAMLNWEFNFPIFAAGLGLGVSTLIGLVFGLYPAKQASRKSPIEALRYE